MTIPRANCKTVKSHVIRMPGEDENSAVGCVTRADGLVMLVFSRTARRKQSRVRVKKGFHPGFVRFRKGNMLVFQVLTTRDRAFALRDALTALLKYEEVD